MSVGDSLELLVGYDGSPGAATAIEVGARLLPDRSVAVVCLWAPPYLDPDLRGRLWAQTLDMDQLGDLIELQGEADAERRAGAGVALAAAAGWDAAPLLQRSYGNPGFELARLADQRAAQAVIVGSRGLAGARALLGSTSDSTAHYSPVPVLVVPHPLLERDRRATNQGTVVVGSDGSEGAARALDAAQLLLSDRAVAVVQVASEDEAHEQGVTSVRPKGVIHSARAVADALTEEARVQEAGLVVVGSRGHSARREVLLGSVAMAVLHHSHMPVLVVPPRNR